MRSTSGGCEICSEPETDSARDVILRGSRPRDQTSRSLNGIGLTIRGCAGVMPTLFLCGDVMIGRGVDQILAHPCSPGIQEPYIRDARDYVALAEEANGPIARPVSPVYIWGDALHELKRVAPDARIINLETSITTSDDFWPGKGIHYRMHPRNVDCLTAAGVDVSVLANNHVLDYGRAGLDETIATLVEAGLKTTGAGDLQGQAGAVWVRRFHHGLRGITGYEEFRDDLVLMYFPHLDSNTGELIGLRMTPLKIRKMQLIRPSAADRDWLQERLANVSRNFGCDVTMAPDDTLEVQRSFHHSR